MTPFDGFPRHAGVAPHMVRSHACGDAAGSEPEAKLFSNDPVAEQMMHGIILQEVELEEGTQMSLTQWAFHQGR